MCTERAFLRRNYANIDSAVSAVAREHDPSGERLRKATRTPSEAQRAMYAADGLFGGQIS